MFADRSQAAAELAAEMRSFRSAEDTVIMGIPAGGAVVGAELALALHLPFGCLGVYKVPMPAVPDLTLGVIDADGEVTLDPHTELTRHEVRKAGDSVLDRLRDDMARCHEGLAEPVIDGSTVIVVDDAVFSDLPIAAAASYVRRHGATRVVLATPVIWTDIEGDVARHVDDVYALRSGRATGELSHYYRKHDLPGEDVLMRSVRAAYHQQA